MAMLSILCIALLTSSMVLASKATAPKLKNAQRSKGRDLEDMLEHSKSWLQRVYDQKTGWGEETHRAITALSLAKSSLSEGPVHTLMVKQLEINLAVDMARNYSKKMQIADLSLYINALLAVCENPMNFHGFDLLQILRNQLEFEYRIHRTYSPLAILTLCLNNKSEANDERHLLDALNNKMSGMDKIGGSAVALLATDCLYNSLSLKVHFDFFKHVKERLLHKLKDDGMPGNIYESALLYQALDGIEEASEFKNAALEFIKDSQLENGGFGDVLATYNAMPVLSGKSIFNLTANCNGSLYRDSIPLEVLENYSPEVSVDYHLLYGNPVQYSQNLRLRVPRGTNLLDIMRMAEDKCSSYRFRLENNGKNPIVYSIGGTPNDAEKGLYWCLTYGKGQRQGPYTVPYEKSLKAVLPENNDSFKFWYKSM